MPAYGSMPIQPVGYIAYIAWGAPDARPEPLHITSASFSDEAEARAWVEAGRRICTNPTNFACSVVPFYGAARTPHRPSSPGE